MRYSEAKERLLRSLRREISDERVLDAIAVVPREDFVPAELAANAYDDAALPIGESQTISQPLMVAVMLQALRLLPTDVVLDIGTGSGYQAALLSRLARKVVTVERIVPLLERARRRLEYGGYANVEAHAASAILGWPDAAPYDGIVVAAAAPAVPPSLIEQLALGGRLVVPVGTPVEQDLAQVTRRDATVDVRWLGPCRFVPLIGEGGWSGDTLQMQPDEPPI